MQMKPRKTGQFSRNLGVKPVILAALVLTLPLGSPSRALEQLNFTVSSEDKDIDKLVRGASLLVSQESDKVQDVEELFTAARSDYARILAALYAAGHYSAVIRITIDGREAADIAPLDAPKSIKTISVSVDPGPKFQFSQTKITPQANAGKLPTGFRVGETASSSVVQTAVAATILGWREEGHAKAAVVRDNVLADHNARKVSVDIGVDPGPSLRFGPVSVSGAERMEIRRLSLIHI